MKAKDRGLVARMAGNIAGPLLTERISSCHNEAELEATTMGVAELSVAVAGLILTKTDELMNELGESA
jgi:hypothetical protein